MSVEELVKELRHVSAFPRPIHKAPFLMEKAADKLEELAAEVARCHARLEIDRHYVGPDATVETIPYNERMNWPDGIECRDATIKGQDEQLFALRKWRQEYVGKLTIAEAALAEAKRENEALRGALKRIAAPAIFFLSRKDAIEMRDTARTALARNAGGNND